MSFDDDIRETAEPVAVAPQSRAVLDWFPVPPGKFERAAMAGFCESLSPADWILLEQLDPRLKNALLKQTIAIALKWRKRRNVKKQSNRSSNENG
jgi:hypothetical protein